MFVREQKLDKLETPQHEAQYFADFIDMLKARAKYYAAKRRFLERHRLELKRLLSQEMDSLEIARELGTSPLTVDEMVVFYGWQDFVQPESRMAETRQRWADKNQLVASPAQMETLEKTTNWMLKVLRDEFPEVDRERVEDTAKRTFVHSLRSWNPAAGAAFPTYYLNMIKLKMKDLKHAIAKQYDANRALYNARLLAEQLELF